MHLHNVNWIGVCKRATMTTVYALRISKQKNYRTTVKGNHTIRTLKAIVIKKEVSEAVVCTYTLLPINLGYA